MIWRRVKPSARVSGNERANHVTSRPAPPGWKALDLGGQVGLSDHPAAPEGYEGIYRQQSSDNLPCPAPATKSDSERKNGMKYYEVYVSFSVSQVVRVRADQVDSLEGAMATALDEADLPNAGNMFEQESEPCVLNVRDDRGNLLWEDTAELP